MNLLYKINNGILLIVIGVMHSQFAISKNGFAKQFKEFAESGFYAISSGLNELPAQVGLTNFQHFAAFWFFYFGLAVIVLGLLVFYMENKFGYLPNGFVFGYLILVLLGVYMIPNSGMTVFMLPQALFMLFINFYRKRRLQLQSQT